MAVLALPKSPHMTQVVTRPAAAFPAPSVVPYWQLFIDETNPGGAMYRSDGTSWLQVGGVAGSTGDVAIWKSAANEMSVQGNTILKSTAAGVGLLLQQAASQTGDALEVKTSGAVVLARITAAGKLVSQQNSIGYTAPAPLVAADLRATGSQLHLSAADSVDGGYVLGLASNIWFSGGAHHDGTNWKADSTVTSGMFGLSNLGIAYYSGAATTVGATVTITSRFAVDPTGHGMFGASAPIASWALGVLVPVSTDKGLLVRGAASQSGDLITAQDSGAALLFAVTAAGLPRWGPSGNAQTTVGAAGGASALPATPTKYLKVVDSAGTTLVIPAYAAS